jgi:hypothetical protein
MLLGADSQAAQDGVNVALCTPIIVDLLGMVLNLRESVKALSRTDVTSFKLVEQDAPPENWKRQRPGRQARSTPGP